MLRPNAGATPPGPINAKRARPRSAAPVSRHLEASYAAIE
jgi:hypothetical protein